MRRQETRRKRPRFNKKTDCQFCKNKTKPDYKETETLSRFLTDRGKIISRGRSGICAKHQRQVSRQIKRARFLALLPFLTKVKR